MISCWVVRLNVGKRSLNAHFNFLKVEYEFTISKKAECSLVLSQVTTFSIQNILKDKLQIP